jgi:hypothetical protein
MCEVEIDGEVALPKGVSPAKARVVVLFSEGDCLAPGARIIGQALASAKGKYSMEVFPKWGADVTVCAAVETNPGAPVTVYGKSEKPIHAEQTGEIVVSNHKIILAKAALLTLGSPSAGPGGPTAEEAAAATAGPAQ